MNKKIKSNIFQIQNLFPKNIKATDKVLSIYWFVILFIVAAGIVYMAGVFYGGQYDVRETETNLLINKIADCIATGGKLNANFNELNSENFLERCHLNFNVEDEYGFKEQKQYYIELSFGNFNEDSEVIFNLNDKIIVGNENLLINCENKVGTHFAFCVKKSFYVLEKDVSKAIKIFVAIKKVDKNV
jgi:hypothetical protein